MKCEVAEIHIIVDGDLLAAIQVPAYTRSFENVEAMVGEVWTNYVFESKQVGTKPSLADFAMKLLAKATTEPFEQENDDE